MTRSKTRNFIAGFLIACILIGAMCGFMLVDLSTDRYMPGKFEPLFLISSVDETGVTFSAMGGSYTLSAEEAGEVTGAIWNFRGLIPRPIRLAGGLAVWCYEQLTMQDASI